MNNNLQFDYFPSFPIFQSHSKPKTSRLFLSVCPLPISTAQNSSRLPRCDSEFALHKRKKKTILITSRNAITNRCDSSSNEIASLSPYLGSYNIKDTIMRNSDRIKSSYKKRIENRPLSFVLINKNSNPKRGQQLSKIDTCPTISNKTTNNSTLKTMNLFTKNYYVISTEGSKDKKKLYKKIDYKDKKVFKGLDNSKSMTSIKNVNQNEESKGSENLNEKGYLYKVFDTICKNEKKEKCLNKKLMFKLLKQDIQKNELKVKEILDKLKRTQNNNDADLQKKGFILNKGYFCSKEK